jgi:hypothetical protein
MATSDYSAEHKASRAPEYGATKGTTDTAVEARGAVTGHGVSTVLVVSTLAVIVGMALVYAVFFG